jgi:aminomethyltransferase
LPGVTDAGDRRSPLDAAHRRLGAKMVPFGGWDMPLSYPGGTIAEHLACRQAAVAFDVSHLGTVRVRGPGAFDRLQATLTNDLARIRPGRAQYTHLLDPADASVVDDIIVWWVDEQCFDVMPNASNTERVVAALADGGAGARTGDMTAREVTAEDVTSARAIMAVQGPEARARLAALAPEAAAVPRFGVAPFEWRGIPCLAAGTGYTGEDGVELSVPADGAEELWQAVLAAGILPAGLGARDTLRLEAALPLHGHELGPGITPLQAGLGWVVAWDKPSGFWGKGPLVAERQRGVSRKLAGLSTPGRRPPRGGDLVSVDGKPAGAVTSGNFSPVLGHGIALALLPPGPAADATVEIDVRGHPVAATVTTLPFVRRAGSAGAG